MHSTCADVTKTQCGKGGGTYTSGTPAAFHQHSIQPKFSKKISQDEGTHSSPVAGVWGVAVVRGITALRFVEETDDSIERNKESKKGKNTEM